MPEVDLPSSGYEISSNDLTPETGWTTLYFDGTWETPVDRETEPVLNPTTDEKLTDVVIGTAADVDRAFEAAAAAQNDWAERSPQERSAIIDDAIDILDKYWAAAKELLTVESGATSLKAQIELTTAKGMMKESRGLPFQVKGSTEESLIPGKENRVVREPAGVVGVISPWNFPLHLSMRAVAPALALGNAVVLKPASPTAITGGLLLARIFEETGLPDGLLNVVTGPGSTVGDRLAAHPDASVVAFTGSTDVGKHVASTTAGHLATPVMELGGNNPYVVTEYADLDAAIDAGVYGSFLHQGQVCISINRHLVHEDVYDEYVGRLADRASELVVGDPLERETDIGPVITDKQYEEIATLIKKSINGGATLETGGAREGRFIAPTVLSDATNDTAAACTEHFGPVAPIVPYSNDSEAVELANDTEYGLAAAVQSTDLAQAEAIAADIEAGSVHINDQPINEEPHIPFGGTKASGLGKFHGEQFIEVLTESKWISVQRQPRRYPL